MRLRATVSLCLSAAVGACAHPCSPDITIPLAQSAADPSPSQSQYSGALSGPSQSNISAWELRPADEQGRYLLCPIDGDNGKTGQETGQLFVADLGGGGWARPGPSCLPVQLTHRANTAATSGGVGFLSALPFKLPIEADFGDDGLVSVELNPPRCRAVPGQLTGATTGWPGLSILTPFVKLRFGDTTPPDSKN